MLRFGQLERLVGWLGLCGLLGVTAAIGSARADTVSDFYSHKTVTLIAGFPPGRRI